MTSTDDISQMFDDESLKLQNLIKIAESNYDLNIHEIVETYYQVMNVSSMSTMLKEQIESQPDSLLNKIQIINKSISERFNSNIHPRIMKTLSTSIKETTEKLQSGNTDKKSKEEIESEAKLFEELRQKMSTREFVEQYNKGLYND